MYGILNFHSSTDCQIISPGQDVWHWEEQQL